MNKKKAFSIILFISIALIIFTFFLKPLMKEDKIIENSKILIHQDIRNNILRDDETYICMAIASNDILVCDESSKKIENCYDTYYFYHSIFSETNSCNEITDSRKEVCNAILIDDINSCKEIVSDMDKIFSDELKLICEAKIKNDASMCKKINNSEDKEVCESLINIIEIVKNKNIDECSTLDYHNYLKCKSIIMKNESICIEERVNNNLNILKEDCRNKTKQLSNAEKSFCKLYI